MDFLTPGRLLDNQNFFLKKKSNKCDRRITESSKKNLVYEGREFYRLNQRILPKRTGDILVVVVVVVVFFFRRKMIVLIIGPFIREKIRRVLSKTRADRINGTK